MMFVLECVTMPVLLIKTRTLSISCFHLRTFLNAKVTQRLFSSRMIFTFWSRHGLIKQFYSRCYTTMTLIAFRFDVFFAFLFRIHHLWRHLRFFAPKIT